MISDELLARVAAEVREHVCRSKGYYKDEPNLNPFTPVDPVAAFAMARWLVEQEQFDEYVVVAPEGHVYGYFFARCGANILTVHVGYPPIRCEPLDDLRVLRDRRVLILEDDVASGTSLRRVVPTLQAFQPRSIDLYLGRPKDAQILEHVDPAIGKVYLAEDCLALDRREDYEDQFVAAFGNRENA